MWSASFSRVVAQENSPFFLKCSAQWFKAFLMVATKDRNPRLSEDLIAIHSIMALNRLRSCRSQIYPQTGSTRLPVLAALDNQL